MRTSGFGADHHNLHQSLREVFVVHRNAPLSETGRLRLARCVVENGWPLRRAAARFQVSHTTAARWAARYRRLGACGMADRPSRPRCSPARTAQRIERRIVGLRVTRRLGPARIALRLGLAPSTVHAHPTGEWTVQQARDLALDLGERFGDFRFLIRDRGSNFTASFDAVFQATGTTIVRTAVQAPRMNAICERLIGTLRRELPDRTLSLDQAHLRAVLAEYQEHYNTARPHQGLDQRIPDPGPAPRVTAADPGTCQIRRNRS
jgi:transposase InsO family protein